MFLPRELRGSSAYPSRSTLKALRDARTSYPRYTGTMRQYSADLVTWVRNCGSVDITDLPGHGTSLAFKPGANFELRSPRTGQVITMYYVETTRNSEDEVIGWHYTGTAPGPNGRKTLIVNVYND